MAEDALPEDQQERKRKERAEHRVCRQSYDGNGQSHLRPTSGKQLSLIPSSIPDIHRSELFTMFRLPEQINLKTHFFCMRYTTICNL